MEPLQRFFLIFLGIMAIGAGATLFLGKAYPDCDNDRARAVLAKLYDNRRLLHAVDVNGLRQLSDGLKGRYCAASIKWGDGTESEVSYEFYYSGRSNQYLSMWIDYNGGMRGPTF